MTSNEIYFLQFYFEENNHKIKYSGIQTMVAQMQRRHEIKNRLFGSNVNLFEFNLKLIKKQ